MLSFAYDESHHHRTLSQVPLTLPNTLLFKSFTNFCLNSIVALARCVGINSIYSQGFLLCSDSISLGQASLYLTKSGAELKG